MIRQALLTVVIPIVFGYAIGACLTGCGSTFAEIDAAAASGDVPAKLRKCRAEARAEFYVGQKSEAESLAKYESCKKREGL